MTNKVDLESLKLTLSCVDKVIGYEELLDNLEFQLEQAISEIEKEKPFVGIPEKDYYRGQWDALTWVLEKLTGEEL